MKQPRLVIRVSVQGETAYRCSVCGSTFSLCESVAPKEMMATLLATFKDHVRTSHSDDVANTEHRPENGQET
jgi:hypothetical protein